MKITQIRLSTHILALGAALLVPLAGCHSNAPADVRGEDFRPQDERRNVARFADAQSAIGARADSTLFAAHFDGEELNSLGRKKLDLILDGGESQTDVIVYLDIAQPDNVLKAREETVTMYLKDHGLLDSQITISAGPNPNSFSPAADNIASLHELNTTGASGSAPAGPGGAAATAATPAAH